MSFVWSQEQVERYLSYYQDIRTRHSWAYATFAVSKEYARTVLPPCLEPAKRPAVTFSFGVFMEWIKGTANRNSMDLVGAIGINARYGDEEGNYYLSVVEQDEVNVVTGRELWGTPKKLGKVDFYNDGKSLYALCERRGARLIELQAALSDPIETSGEEDKDITFELRGYFGPNGQGLTGSQLVIFENHTLTHSARPLTDVHVVLGDSPYDPGVSGIPLEECIDAVLVGGETSYVDCH